MPTETDPRLPAARGVDSPTARTPAIYPGDPKVAAAAHPAVVSPAVVREYADEFSPPLSDDPGPPVEEGRPEWATANLSPAAARLHARWCDCAWGGDVYEHGIDFERFAAEERAHVLAETAAPVKAPVEAKVIAGAWSTLAAALVLAVSTAGLQHIDAVRALIGDNPWSGPAVLAVGVVLTAAQSWAAYQAPHAPRPAGQVQR